MDYSVFIDRESNFFQIVFDYYIEPYYDPETGEVFSETSWTVNYGSGGTGGWGAPEQNSVPIDSSFSAATSLNQIAINFFAQNSFSGVSDSLMLNLFEAGYATEALSTAGTSIVDIIVSGSGDDTLGGGSGDDVIDAGAGDDTLAGDDGDDLLDGGFGDDTMTGGAGNDTYRVDSLADAVVEGAGGGTDTVEATISHTLALEVEQLQLLGSARLNGTGNGGNNAISGNAAANLLRGLDGDDQLYGEGGNDRLEGGAGNDTLHGGAGRDVMEGGNGDDSYYVDSVSDQAIEALSGGTDRVYTALSNYALGDNIEELWLTSFGTSRGTGNGLANNIVGTAAANTLMGLAGNDVLDGKDGRDTLIGGAGADELRGGLDSDWASYETSTGSVRVNLLAGLGLYGDARGDTLVEIENMRGGAGNDTLIGDDAANRIDGGAGNDLLRGGLGDDFVTGGAGADRLYGQDGWDTVSYRGSVGAVHVDLAARTASGGDAQGDTISGFENAAGGLGGDTIIGSNAANVLSGDDGNDTIDGGRGDDVVQGGRGADTLSGGLGVDILSYAAADGGVQVNLAAGTASGSDANGDSFSGFENVMGSAHDDILTGNGLANTLRGGGGDDTIDGGDGNDTVVGGTGSDSLTGGAGIDTLSYSVATSWVSVSLAGGYGHEGSGGNDSFSGFENLTGSAFGDSLYGDVGNNLIKGGAGSDYIVGGGGNDRVYGQAGDDLFVFLSGRVTIRDFVAGGTEDRIEVVRGEDFDTLSEVLAVATTTDAGNTVFRFSKTETLTLTGVDKASLTAADFVFYTDELLV